MNTDTSAKTAAAGTPAKDPSPPEVALPPDANAEITAADAPGGYPNLPEKTDEQKEAPTDAAREEEERTQWHPIMTAAIRVTSYELGLHAQSIPERSLWKLPKRADQVDLWTMSGDDKKNPFAPHGERYTVFEGKGKGVTCNQCSG